MYPDTWFQRNTHPPRPRSYFRTCPVPIRACRVWFAKTIVPEAIDKRTSRIRRGAAHPSLPSSHPYPELSGLSIKGVDASALEGF